MKAVNSLKGVKGLKGLRGTKGVEGIKGLNRGKEVKSFPICIENYTGIEIIFRGPMTEWQYFDMVRFFRSSSTKVNVQFFEIVFLQ